ncbi:MAG TPA: hypothetical protein VFW98_00835 [Gemmatimonadaceae bacterium]|nr:hypothetical protein [Gemmatimonadaceae bacterium]
MTAPRDALSFRRELTRKALHIATVIVPIAYAAGVTRRVLLIVLACACALAFAIDILRIRHASTRAVFHRLVGQLLRAHEERRWAGATWLLLAQLGAVAVAPRPAAIAAMWAVSAADAAAALAGKGLGRRRVARSGKTIVGSVACFVVALAGAVLLAELAPAAGVVAAAAATLGERPQGGLDDNVRIVAAVVLALLLWRVIFP